MTTIRSQYAISQFYERLRKKAHEMAIDIVTNLNAEATIKIGPDGIDITGTDIEIRFYASHISYRTQGKPVKKISGWRECPKCEYGWTHETRCSRCGEETQPSYMTTYPDSFFIDIEEKNYTSSNHSTKISYTEGQKERAEQFISELMKGVEIKPRFSLSKHIPPE